MNKPISHFSKKKKLPNLSTFSSPRATICDATLGKLVMCWRVVAVSVLALPSTQN